MKDNERDVFELEPKTTLETNQLQTSNSPDSFRSLSGKPDNVVTEIIWMLAG